MGLDVSDLDNVSRNRPEHDFNLLSKQFIADMLVDNPKVHSRQNKDSVVAYARELGSIAGLTHQRTEPEPLAAEPQKRKAGRKKHPGKARRPQRLPYRPHISSALNSLKNWKLQSLYHSLCDVALQENTPLLAVGTWAFLESLTAQAGRDSNISFDSFLSQQRLTEYGPRHQAGH